MKLLPPLKYEHPQKGNPQKLTIMQHVFPKRSIERFCASHSTVQVFRRAASQTLMLKATDPVFCARRIWSQSVEHQMTYIERQFQEVASAVETGKLTSLSGFDSDAASLFYALWITRFRWKNRRIEDPVMPDTLGASLPLASSVAVNEILEANGYSYARPDGSVPARFITGMVLSLEMGRAYRALQGRHWGILRASGGHFIVPDNFGDASVIPISSSIILAMGEDDRSLTRSETKYFNWLALSSYDEFLFAKDFGKAAL